MPTNTVPPAPELLEFVSVMSICLDFIVVAVGARTVPKKLPKTPKLLDPDVPERVSGLLLKTLKLSESITSITVKIPL